MHINILEAPETGYQMHSDVNVFDSVIRSRKAVRVFRPDAVSRKDIVDILDVARTAPSNSNMQPWRVHVLSGSIKESLSEALLRAHVADLHPPLRHIPDPMPEEYRPMQEAFGIRYYGALGVDKADFAARARVTGRNFGFFGAPVGLIFSVDARLTKYSWLDYGLFLQTVMLAARARGLDTCPQVSFARYQAIIAEHLSLDPDYDVVCGMSLGYADHDSAVNRLAIPREKVESFTTFVGFDEKL